MISVLLILIPLLAGLFTFFLKKNELAKAWTLGISAITFSIGVIALSIP